MVYNTVEIIWVTIYTENYAHFTDNPPHFTPPQHTFLTQDRKNEFSRSCLERAFESFVWIEIEVSILYFPCLAIDSATVIKRAYFHLLLSKDTECRTRFNHLTFNLVSKSITMTNPFSFINFNLFVRVIGKSSAPCLSISMRNVLNYPMSRSLCFLWVFFFFTVKVYVLKLNWKKLVLY